MVTKVQLAEADAGIVYISDAVAAPELKTIEIPADYNIMAKYPIAILTNAPQPDLADEFIASILSPDGQVTQQKWGFTPVNPKLVHGYYVIAPPTYFSQRHEQQNRLANPPAKSGLAGTIRSASAGARLARHGQ